MRDPARWVTPVLTALVLGALGAGIWASYRSTFPGDDLYRITAVFQARAGETLILVTHGAVAGLMDEMGSMALAVESKALLDRADLRPGDRVRLTVRQRTEPLLVIDLAKLD